MSIQRDSATGRVSIRDGNDGDVALVQASAAYATLPDGTVDPADHQGDDDERATLRQVVAALLADAARLRDTTVTLTTAQLRAHLARTDDALAGLLRYLGRRGL